ncbi:anti-sigma factor [Nocardioides aurantiacus]|uniref:anti-sigma factor n=1 Tax=Nocardioides aurantiacus TaxID=86796 RepID=UPI00403F8D7D
MTTSIHALSGAYAVDALDDDERAGFEAHLPGCRDCQVEVAELRRAAAELGHELAEEPPAALRASVLAAISTVRPLPPEAPVVEEPAADTRSTAPTGVVVPLRRSGRRRLANLAVAAAILGVVGVGAVTQPWSPDTSTPSRNLSAADRVLSADDAETVTQKFPDGSSATVTRSVTEGRAVLSTKKMAAPPAGKAFEMWLLIEGRMAPAGLMTEGGDQTFVLTGDGGAATAVGITVEPETGSAAPTTDPIALMEFESA